MDGAHASNGRHVAGVGIDLIEIERVRLAIEERPRFVERIFTPEEQAYCGRFKNPARHWAARFAAKEAVMKSLGVGPGRVRWRDISVSGPGRPIVSLSGGAAERAKVLGVVGVEVSLSHSADLATAVASALAD